MMDLGSSLFSVLNATSNVSVEGLGVFVRHRTPAQPDVEGAYYLPPSITYELKADWDDSAVSLTEYFETTAPDSGVNWKKEIETAVDKLVEKLVEQGKVDLFPLGTLSQEGDAVVLVPPAQSARWPKVAIPSSLQTRPSEPEAQIPVAEIEEANELHESNVELQPEVTPSEDKEAIWTTVEVEQPIQPTEEYIEEEKASSLVWLWILLAIVVAGLGVWFLKPDWIRSGTKWIQSDANTTQQAPVVLPEGPAPTVSHFDSVQKAQLLLDSLRKDSITVQQTLQDSLAKIAAAGPKVTYEIIVGSFVSMQQADKYVAAMKAKGIELKALDSRMPGNRKKVSWGSYPTEEAAYNELVKVQRDFEKGAWVARVVHD